MSFTSGTAIGQYCETTEQSITEEPREEKNEAAFLSGEIWPLWPPDSAGLAAASGISSGQIAAPLPDLAAQRLLSGEGPR